MHKEIAMHIFNHLSIVKLHKKIILSLCIIYLVFSRLNDIIDLSNEREVINYERKQNTRGA